MKTPKRAEAQVGFFAAQSKQDLFSRREAKRFRVACASFATCWVAEGAIVGEGRGCKGGEVRL